MSFEVFIGFDPRERLAWQVACASLQALARQPVAVRPIWRQQLEQAGLYARPHEERGGVLWDCVSDAPCSTEFSVARFGVQAAGRTDWVLYVDVDFLFRADVWEIFDAADPRFAVMLVKHRHSPAETEKMDGQVQRRYERKNWSSCVLWNRKHGTNRQDWHALLSTWHRDRLHGFAWLKDKQIGELPGGEAWNWLDGHSDPALEPKAVHFTRGTPEMAGYENTRFAPEWQRYAEVLRCQG